MISSVNNVINNTTKLVEVVPVESYQAGSCNIGREERDKRLRAGLMGAILAVGWPFICYVFALPIGFKFLTFFPTVAGIIGFWQYRKQYCVYFGLTNKYNFKELGKAIDIVDQKQKEIDKLQSQKMILITIAASILYTILVVLLF